MCRNASSSTVLVAQARHNSAANMPRSIVRSELTESCVFDVIEINFNYFSVFGASSPLMLSLSRVRNIRSQESPRLREWNQTTVQ